MRTVSARNGARSRRGYVGFSMVEALIAVLIVAIGLMGVAGLIVESVKNGHGALLRTQAVNLVSDMQERIRANPLGGDAYDCARYSSGPSLLGCTALGSMPAAAKCSARELAEDDLAEWQRAVRRALPSIMPSFCAADVRYAGGDATQPARYTVSVSWQQRNEPLSYQSELLVLTPTPH